MSLTTPSLGHLSWATLKMEVGSTSETLVTNIESVLLPPTWTTAKIEAERPFEMLLPVYQYTRCYHRRSPSTAVKT
jgi:hypothetical protein